MLKDHVVQKLANAVADKIVVVEPFESRIMIKRSELFKRIREMVVIMNDFMQEPLFAHLRGVTIPYYCVGIDDEITQELRSFFAEMILIATFEYPRWPTAGISGTNMSRLPTMSITLAHWIAKAEHLNTAEREFLSAFCNPTRYIPGHGFCAWGSGGYLHGHWYANLVTVEGIKYLLGFDDKTHMVVYDDN